MARLEKLLVLALLVFLPSQLSFHWWPDWSLVAGVRIDYLSPTLYFTDVLVLIVILFGFWKKFIKVPRIVGFIFLAAVVNILFSLSPFVAIYHWLRFGELFFLGLYFYSRSKHLKNVLAAGLVVALLWTSILAIWQFAKQSSVGGAWYFLGERRFSLTTPGIAKLDLGDYGFWLRPYATLPHPNALAGFLLVGSLVVYSLVPKPKKSWLVPIAAAIFLSWSRAVFAALVALVAFPLAPLVFFLPGNPQSLSERWTLSTTALQATSQHLFTGLGLGNFINYLGGRSFQPVHNIFLLALSELGILGFVFLVVYLIHIIRGLVQRRQWMLLKILAVVLGLGLVDHYWLTLHQTQLLLTIFLAQTALQSKTS